LEPWVPPPLLVPPPPPFNLFFGGKPPPLSPPPHPVGWKKTLPRWGKKTFVFWFFSPIFGLVTPTSFLGCFGKNFRWGYGVWVHKTLPGFKVGAQPPWGLNFFFFPSPPPAPQRGLAFCHFFEPLGPPTPKPQKNKIFFALSFFFPPPICLWVGWFFPPLVWGGSSGFTPPPQPNLPTFLWVLPPPTIVGMFFFWRG